MKTKKSVALWLIGGAVLMGTVCRGQSGDANPQTFTQGANVINVGLGLGGEYSYWGAGYTSIPTFALSYENGTFGNVGPGTISLGGLLAYKSVSYNWTSSDGVNTYNYNNKWNYWIIGFRSAYHWNFTTSNKFDPYAGLMLGYYVVSHTYSSNDPYYKNPGDPGYVYYNGAYGSYMSLSIFLGARYYVSSNVGLWAELGWGYSNLALGVNFKL